jgi:dTDP-4-amino-4,6-dideoxygalactose transaminase
MRRHAPCGWPIDIGMFAQPSGSTSVWQGGDARYFDSATSALAVAIGAARGARVPSAEPCEVLLPAYGCPNLVAAAEFAGARQRFVDFAVGTATPVEVAVPADGAAMQVVVDFCGVPAQLRDANGAARAGVIHDLAQSYQPFLRRWTQSAPLTVVSFGRAKPLSLTLGGALLGAGGPAAAQPVTRGAPRVRARLYNLSMQPRVFALLARLPFLGIGMTRFRPLQAVREFDAQFGRWVGAAIAEFQRRQQTVLAGTRRALEFAAECGLSMPFEPTRLPADLPLWRLPVCFEHAEAAEQFARAGAGVGVSRLYRRTLPELVGVGAGEARERWPNAWRLSRTLVTLPTHGRLAESDWQMLKRLATRKGN